MTADEKFHFLDSIECSEQPLDFAFHPTRSNIIAAGLVDGTLEVHDVQIDEDEINDGDDEESPESLLSSVAIHTKELSFSSKSKNSKDNKKQKKVESCRSIAFSTSDNGKRIFTGGSSGSFCCTDSEIVCTFSAQPQKSLLWKVDNGTTLNETSSTNPLVIIKPFEKTTSSSYLIATGDDTGGVRVWDERIIGDGQSGNIYKNLPRGCIYEWNENEDYISDIQHSSDGNTIVATSADGRLAVFDLRMATKGGTSSIFKHRKNEDETTTKNKKGGGSISTTFRLSDDQEDELLSLQIMKQGKKVICGTQEGVLSIFSWGTWGDCSDRFPGHPSSIETLLKIDEDTLLTGSSDGLIRVIQLQPNKLLGILNSNIGGEGQQSRAQNEGFPIEKLGFNSNRNIVGSISAHDSHIRLWDTSILHDNDDDDDSDDEDEDNDQKKPTSTTTMAVKATKTTTGTVDGNSDDEWDDMDDNNGDSDDSDSDGSDHDDQKVATANDKRKNRLKTDNEKFFDDL